MEEQKEKDDLNFELVDAEEVSPLYFNGELIQPPFRLYRLSISGNRVYFYFEDEENFQNPKMFMGTGTVTSVMPTSKELIKYKSRMGWEESERELQMWSYYGSFSDSRIAEFVQNGRFDKGIAGLDQHIKEYYYLKNFFLDDAERTFLCKCIRKDMIGFEKFVYDRHVEFVFVEYPVVSHLDGTATPIDFGCFFDLERSETFIKKDGEESKTKKAIEERAFGLFNYKSGKIYPNYGVQCWLERQMFMENYPSFTELPVRSFNLTIREWKTTNGWDKYRRTSDFGKPYQIKEWTNEVNEDDCRDYLSIAKRKFEKRLNRNVTFIEGDMKIGENVTQYITSKTIQEIILDGSWRQVVKENKDLLPTI